MLQVLRSATPSLDAEFVEVHCNEFGELSTRLPSQPAMSGHVTPGPADSDPKVAENAGQSSDGKGDSAYLTRGNLSSNDIPKDCDACKNVQPENSSILPTDYPQGSESAGTVKLSTCKSLAACSLGDAAGNDSSGAGSNHVDDNISNNAKSEASSTSAAVQPPECSSWLCPRVAVTAGAAIAAFWWYSTDMRKRDVQKVNLVEDSV